MTNALFIDFTAGAQSLTGRVSTLDALMAQMLTQQVQATFTRASNTSPDYAADSIMTGNGGGALIFAGMGVSGDVIEITQTSIDLVATSIPSGMANFYLSLYSSTPHSALADKGLLSTSLNDSTDRSQNIGLGFLDLGTPTLRGGHILNWTNENMSKKVKLTGTDLFAYLITAGAHTPIASLAGTITLMYRK